MTTLYPNWQDRIVFSAAAPQPQALLEAGGFRVILAGLEPGQRIPPHPEAAALYHILAGTGWMTVDDERFAVAPGATVVMAAGARRGLEAETRLAFLAARAS